MRETSLCSADELSELLIKVFRGKCLSEDLLFEVCSR